MLHLPFTCTLTGALVCARFLGVDKSAKYRPAPAKAVADPIPTQPLAKVRCKKESAEARPNIPN